MESRVSTKSSSAVLLATAGLALVFLTACNMLEGDGKSADKKAEATPVAEAPATPALSLTEMANLRLPLPSPRREGVRVASLDPKQATMALKTTMTAQELAGAFIQFDTGLAVAENSKLQTPKEVRRVLSHLRYKTGEEMATGWFAMRALAASKEDAFVKGVNAQILAKGRDKFLNLIQDEKYVNSIPGAGAAAQAVIAASAIDDTRLKSLSSKFIETAARFQKSKYGMQTPLPSQPVTQLASDEGRGSLMTDVQEVLAALSPVSTAHADYSPGVMAHILALAARRITTDNMAGAPLSTADKETARCMTWARLNLNQCVAAAHFPSEEAWCTGKHALDDVRKCMATVLPPSAAAP